MKREVLDHGFVELVDVMGDDQAIVDAARISVSGENVKSVQSNEALIRYLMRHSHTTPFEMVEFKFRVAMPIFVARQWVRHRTASINELSARYSELPATFYVPKSEHVQKQADKNKQGRAEELIDGAESWTRGYQEEAAESFGCYKDRLNAGIARELARINLPLSAYTAWIWKIDLHNLFHFLRLRLHPHAQMEIRVYAEAMAAMVKEKVPMAFEAFEDFRLNALTLTGPEVAAIRRLRKGFSMDDVQLGFATKREAEEFREKWKTINYG